MSANLASYHQIMGSGSTKMLNQSQSVVSKILILWQHCFEMILFQFKQMSQADLKIRLSPHKGIYLAVMKVLILTSWK